MESGNVTINDTDIPVISENFVQLNFSYTVELWTYGVAFCLGVPSFIYTVQRLIRTSRKNLILAARLFSYKISLTVGDFIVLFVYAPIQFTWIRSYFWFGGSYGCTLFKFISAFGFHLTANMQVLVAVDRLLITAKMNRMNRNMKKRQYNTRICLAVAWILAFICAAPQLLIFKEAVSTDGKKQCISVFTEQYTDYFIHLENIEKYGAIKQYNEFLMQEYRETKNATILSSLIRGFVKPNITMSELNDRKNRWRIAENIYNAIHLSTISVIPFLLVLICYTMILYMLKGAMSGKFVSISDIYKKIFCGCFTKQRITSPSESNLTQESDNLVPAKSARMKLVRTISIENRRSASMEMPNSQRSASCVSVCLNGHGSPTITIHPLPQVVRIRPLSILQRCLSSILPARFFKNSQEHTIPLSPNCYDANSGRRTSEPEKARTNTMWVNTVDTARKNTKWKAFAMISLNLFFWAPYVIIAVASSFIETRTMMYLQFVNSILAFNAISNIIL